MSKTGKAPETNRIWSVGKALASPLRPYTVRKRKGTSIPVLKATIPKPVYRDGRWRTPRCMPPEYYKLSEQTRKNTLTRCTAWQLKFSFDYILHGIHWHGYLPSTEEWRLECCTRLLLLLRDSDEPKQVERYRHLLTQYQRAGEESWTAADWDKYRLPRQPGWKTHGSRRIELPDSKASGALYWPETWDVPPCPECGADRCVDACTNVYYCWNERCCKSRWNSAAPGRRTGNVSFQQSLGSIVKDNRSLLREAKTHRPVQTEAEKAGTELRDMLEQVQALDLLKQKRMK